MIVVIQSQLPHYRRGFFNKLSELEDVLIIHSGKSIVTSADRFTEIIVQERKLGPFSLQFGLRDVINTYKPSAVIAAFDIRNLMSFVLKVRLRSKVKWIWWGLDKGANETATKIKTWLARGRSPIVFYNSKVRDLFAARGLAPYKLFVANNTFHVENHRSFHDHKPKDIFINVGTLDPRKQNDVLVRTFKAVLEQTGRDLSLYLIGEGRDRDMLTSLIDELKLADRVFLTGKIEDSAVLEGYYARALASVSFGQAGLAVLQSMAFGVPFVTKRSAISGGEKYNIIDNYNGIFCNDDPRSLEQVMIQLAEDEKTTRAMGANAYTYYRDQASVDVMVEGFRSALSYGAK
jgi:glycosyltransferase involved in cell wall biosynthesis